LGQAGQKLALTLALSSTTHCGNDLSSPNEIPGFSSNKSTIPGSKKAINDMRHEEGRNILFLVRVSGITFLKVVLTFSSPNRDRDMNLVLFL
jgi:hypothetical protein